MRAEARRRTGLHEFVSSGAEVALVALLALISDPARGDEVRLENGDVVRGEVLTGNEKEVRIRHVYGSELAIPWTNVVFIQTDKVVELKMLDGSRLKGKLGAGPRPKTATLSSESLGAVSGVELDRLAALNEPKDDAIWLGRIAVGLTLQDGNTRSQTFFGSFDGERRSKRDRIEAHAYYAYGTTEGVLATKKGFARAQYSYYVLHPLYVYVGGAFEYDRFQDLTLRSRGGGGLGVAFVETKEKVARLEAGAEYVNEDLFDPVPDQNYTALRFAGHLEWQVTDSLRLGEDVEVLPSTKQFRNFTSRSVSSANLALWKGFGLAGIIIWQHVELPQGAVLRDDVTYIITFTYVF